MWGMYLKTNDIFFLRNLMFDKFFSLTVCPMFKFNNLDVVHQVDFNDSSCKGTVRLVIMFLQIILKCGLVQPVKQTPLTEGPRPRKGPCLVFTNVLYWYQTNNTPELP